MQKHKIVTMKLSDLKMAPWNPRKIGPKAMKGLQNSLNEFGIMETLVWDKRSGFLIGGHQRMRALMEMGEQEAPVMVVDFPLSKAKRANVTLNNPKIAGEWADNLDGLLDELKKDEPDLYKRLRLDALEAQARREKEEPGEVQFTEELMEAQNYVVLYFSNAIDWLQLQSLYPLSRVKALDSKPGFTKMGIGRVINGADFIKKLTEEK